MATSPNYGWAEPDNSSLVKNGAQDIRALGDAIDTSVWNIGYGQAAKNKIINGDFSVNQRAFSSTTTSGVYMFDRWGNYLSDGTVTYSAQTFTPGDAPVAGYESANFIRCVTSGQSAAGAAAQLAQPIENVRTFAGQTVTISFWAKAATGTPKIGIELAQTFGSGGSSSVFSAVGAVTISTSWVRYSATYAVPSISGKTIGSSSFLGVNLWTSAGTTFATRASSIGIQSATIDIWGIQLEAGSVATPFQTATGAFASELALCRRYYQNSIRNGTVTVGQASSTSAAFGCFMLDTLMRTTPTIILPAVGTASGQATFLTASAGFPAVSGSITPSAVTNYGYELVVTGFTAFVAGNASMYYANGAASFQASAEL
jgi:hypothetical protein